MLTDLHLGSLGKCPYQRQYLKFCTHVQWVISDSHHHFIWNTVCFMRFLTPSVLFPQKTLVFHQRSLKTVFHSGLGTLGPAFPNTSLHSGHLQGCSQGNMQAGYVCSPPTCLQGQGVMLVARSLNLVGLTSVQSHSSYFHLTIFLDYEFSQEHCTVFPIKSEAIHGLHERISQEV